jgi:hypothetical protein
MPSGRPDPSNKRKLEGMEFLLGRLFDLYDRPPSNGYRGSTPTSATGVRSTF